MSDDDTIFARCVAAARDAAHGPSRARNKPESDRYYEAIAAAVLGAAKDIGGNADGDRCIAAGATCIVGAGQMSDAYQCWRTIIDAIILGRSHES